MNSLPVALSLTIRSLAFSLYEEKCPFLSRKRTVVVMNRGQRVNMAKKSKRHTGGFILKKAPKHDKKEAQHHFMAWCWAFPDYSDFQRVKQCACLQIALSHFAVWRGNVLFRKISRAEAYRVYSIVLCFLIYFFAQEERNLLFSLRSILARRFYCLIVNSLSN